MSRVAAALALVIVVVTLSTLVTSSVLAQQSHPVIVQEVLTLEGTDVRFFAIRDMSQGVTCYYLTLSSGGGMQCVK